MEYKTILGVWDHIIWNTQQYWEFGIILYGIQNNIGSLGSYYLEYKTVLGVWDHIIWNTKQYWEFGIILSGIHNRNLFLIET